MFNLELLNAKERKRLIAQLEKQFGCGAEPLRPYALLLNESSGRISIVNEDVLELDLRGLHADAVGLYLGTKLANGEVRLSIEGSQLLGPHSTRNVLDLTDENFFHWIRGRAVEKETDLKGFVILRHGQDYCGCGKPVLDEKSQRVAIHNYIPKTRYVRSED